jgi:ferredoxin-type protein NapG
MTDRPAGKMRLADAARRRFVASAGALGAAGLLSLGAGFVARDARALQAQAVRPPGAIAEPAFLGACVRCGQCVRACPYGTLRLAEPGSGVGAGTPYFVARDVPCEMCEDVPCVKACPTTALDHGLTDIGKARMGVAVLVDEERCLNALGLRCDVCYRVCPVIDKAITLDTRHNARTAKHAMFIPTVHSDACTGCGKCERSCVLDGEAAIKVLPLKLAQAGGSGHYRLGWKEKEKAGRSLIPDAVELPVRRPEARMSERGVSQGPKGASANDCGGRPLDVSLCTSGSEAAQ